MKRGDIWMVTLYGGVGRETRDEDIKRRHRVMIVSADEFNAAGAVPIVVPILSTGNWERARGFTVTLMGAGTETTGVTIVNQVRVCDVRGRNGRFVETAPNFVIDEVMDKLRTILE